MMLRLSQLPILILSVLCANAQVPDAQAIMARALHLADLYNWADAGPLFTKAEGLFASAGDRRNALHARLGRIRSTLEQEQRALPEISLQLATELDANPILQTDKRLRMFCLIVKGDIDTETDTRAMRADWQQVHALARELGDAKWEYRAVAQLGVAAFFEGDIETARKNVAATVFSATKSGDIGAQVRYITSLGIGLLHSRMYEQAIPLFDNALKIAASVPDTGYQFLTKEVRLNALIGLKQFEAAERLADEILTHAKQKRRVAHEAIVHELKARIFRARKDDRAALATLEQSMAIAESAGLTRTLASVQSLVSDIYRDSGDLTKAEKFAERAAASTQASGDVWAVPRRLQTVAELMIRRGKYTEADAIYDRAGAFVDSMIGNVPSILDKTALIKAASDIYGQHLSLVADRFRNTPKAYAIVEQVRGRVATDMLMAGSIASDEAKRTERAIAQLRLKLMAARSTADVRKIRDQIFLVEQSRWVTPEVSILKTRSNETIELEQVQKTLPPSAVILEYVVANPRSYCLVITRNGSRIVPLAGKDRIEALVSEYLKGVKAKRPGRIEARGLYDAILQPIAESTSKENLVVVRDGQLHLVPFGALLDMKERYVVEGHTVMYVPSATSFYLLAQQKRRVGSAPRALLGVGGIPYSGSNINKAFPTIRSDAAKLSDLPSSTDEVRAAQSALRDENSTLLLGSAATEAAFKRRDLARYRVVHLAVHGFADAAHPDRAALLFLSDPSQGEDGLLQATEIVQMKLNADLVVLSACETAVGPLQGQEGIAALSRAFLLAGARSVVSTLWSIDDTVSLSLMQLFYKHVAAKKSAANALTAAQRDILQQFGRDVLPYYWAGFTFEGVADGAISANP